VFCWPQTGEKALPDVAGLAAANLTTVGETIWCDDVEGLLRTLVENGVLESYRTGASGAIDDLTFWGRRTDWGCAGSIPLFSNNLTSLFLSTPFAELRLFASSV